MPRLVAEAGQMGYLAGNGFAGGLVLGAASARGEVMIELIRAVPTRVALLCADPWLARLLTIRVAGMGAKTVVATDRTGAWEHFVNVIGGRLPVATVRTDHAAALPAPSVGSPLVVVDDTRDIPSETYAPRMPWQSTIHVRAGVNEVSRALVDASHVVLVCRLDPDAATGASTALGLGTTGAAAVSALGERDVLVVADGRAHRVLVTPTPSEQRML